MSDHQRPQSKLDDGRLYQGEREEKLAVAVFSVGCWLEREKGIASRQTSQSRAQQYLRRTISPMPLPGQAVLMSASAEKKWEGIQ